MHRFDDSRSGRIFSAIGRAVAAVLLLLAMARPLWAADPTMFEGNRAQHALEAIAAKAGHKLRVLSLDITPEALVAEIQDPGDPDRVVPWRVSQRAGFTSVLGDIAVRSPSTEPTLLRGSLDDNLFDPALADLARLPELAAAAFARARLAEPGAVVQMELRRPLQIVPKRTFEAPLWTIRIKGRRERAEIHTDLSGKITFTNLRGTFRYERLDLRAGGPDLDELVQQIRDEIKDQWAVKYVEVETKSIAFEASLAGTPGAPQVTRFTAGIDGVRTANLDVPRLSFPSARPTDAFSLSDVAWQRLPEMQKRARDSAAIADAKIASVVLLKPKREFGDNEIEWRIAVEAEKRLAFPGPDSPPRPRATAIFDAKGGFVRTKYPRGEGPKIDLLEPAALTKALAIAAARLGRDLKASEVMVTTDEIAITAQDPKKPDSLGAFAYRDQEIERDTGARAMIANSMGFGQGALFDLASLEPAVSGPLAAMQRETLSRLKVANGRVIRLTFSKDRAFRPDNDKVLVEIRVAGDGPDHEWINYELTGKVAATDNMVPSGIRVVRPVSRRDEEDCTRSSEPDVVIAACTRLIGSGQFTTRNLAIFHYDRGIAHKNKKDFDQALSDYSEAIRLDPNYAHAYLNRGVLLADKRELDRAMVDFEAAIRLDPKEKLAYLNRAAAYKIKGDWDRAIADYGEAIRLDPNDFHMLHARGVGHLSKRDYDRAIGDFTEVIRLEPKAAGALTLRGRCHQAKGEYQRAIADFSAAIRLTPRDPAPYIDRASGYRYAGDLDRAIAGYTEALAIDPKSVLAYQNRGWSYRGKGEFARALADYDRAFQLDPKNARLIFARGFTHYLAGSFAKALADVSQANALDPAEPYAALWLDIVGQRSRLPSQMAKATAKVDMTAWPAPVIKLYLGELTTEAALAAAEHSEPGTRRGQVCEVNFYAGDIALRGGAKPEATRLFALAARDCPKTWIELEAANAELKTLAPAR
jgi:lipoprotein NlpI